MKTITMAAALALAPALLGGCASSMPEGERVAKEESYAPTGTYIPRKNGTGLGAAPITAVSKTEVENARAMQSNGVAGMPGAR